MANTVGMDVRHRPPREVPCEWCDAPSIKAIPHYKRKGLFIYVCGKHIRVAEQANTPTKRST